MIYKIYIRAWLLNEVEVFVSKYTFWTGLIELIINLLFVYLEWPTDDNRLIGT